MSYQSVAPNSSRDAYNPGEIVDFIINLPSNREIVAGSFRLSGNVKVLWDGVNPMTGTEQIFYDAKAGMHSVISQTQCSLNGMSVENLPHYGRNAKHISVCQETDIQAVSDIGNACQLKMADNSETRGLLGITGVAANGRSFSLKPYIALNNTSSNIVPAKGELKITFILANVNQFLSGSAVTVDTTYSLNDLLLSYRTVSQTTPTAPLTMNITSALKQILTSGTVNLSVNNPIKSRSLTMSFIASADESNPVSNYLNMSEVPMVSRVEFSFNDLLAGSLLSYPLETREEILYNFVQSQNPMTNKWSVHQTGLNYGVGLQYGEYLPNTKLGVSIQSAVSSLTPMSVYMYFKGQITV